MATNRLTIKRDGNKVLVTSNDANIKQVFFGWASWGTGSGMREYPEFYGSQTKGDGSRGPDNDMWLWTLNEELVRCMIDNLTKYKLQWERGIAVAPASSAEHKADADVQRTLEAFLNETDAEAHQLDEFTHAYITAALWSTNDESTPDGGEPLDKSYGPDDIAPEALAKIKADCAAFQEEHKELLAKAYELYEPRDGYTGAALGGHDMWLNRNGHGCGFWDRGLGDVGEALSEACHKIGERWIEVGDDGKLHGF